MVSVVSVFLYTLFFSLVGYTCLSLALGVGMKLMGFKRTRVVDMFKKYPLRLLLSALLAAVTAVLLFWDQGVGTVDSLWQSLILSGIIWGVILLLWELLAVPGKD